MRLKNIPKEYKGIINSIRRKAQRHKIAVRFEPWKTVHVDDTDIEGSVGYYYTGRELAIATGHSIEEWILTLIHESCHMDQEFDRSVGKELFDYWEDNMIAWTDWLEGKKQMNQLQLSRVVKAVIDCERDCEQRSVAKIKKWNLSKIDIKGYIRSANVYLYCHHIYKERRKFTTAHELTAQESIRKLVSSRFEKNYDTIPIKLKKQILKFLKEEDK